MKSQALRQLHPTKEEELLAARVSDCFALCDRGNVPKFTGFLDLRQQKIAAFSAAGERRADYCFFGGYDAAERRILGVFPDYITDYESAFPIAFVRAVHPRGLTHRDFLGALMSLGIRREMIGDLVVGQEQSYLILMQSIAGHVLENLHKAANIGVRLELCERGDLALSEQRFSEEKVIVTSLRADCVVAALCQKSRADSAKLVAGERVFVNHEVLTSGAASLKSGDVVSVRGTGKFVIGSVEATTKKGRLVLSYKKYI